MIFRQFFQVSCLHCFEGTNEAFQGLMIVLKVVLKGKLMTFHPDFPRVTGLFCIQARPRALLHCPPCFYFICRASRRPITRVKFKFVARQVVASVVIRAAKLEFVAESRTRVYFAQHVASTCNTVFCCETSWSQRGNTRNNVFQLVMQQCCETS